MSDDDLPELGPELRALLDLESDDAPEPPVGAFDRVRARLDVSIAGPDPGGDAADGRDPPGGAPTTAPAPTPPPAGAAELAAAGTVAGSKTALGMVALVAFALGAGSGIVGTKLASPTPAPEVRIEERRVEVPVRVVETVYVSANDAGAGSRAVAPSTLATGARDASVPNGDEPPETGRDRELADENALVSRAQSALARGRAGEALAALSEHQRRFPRGEFVEEREALAIQALARAGNLDAARARAERFRTRFPHSMLSRAVEAAVGGNTP